MRIPILKNTVTNYAGMLVRLVQGILITRWLIRDLGEVHYGLWIMLWSLFCFPLFLDLGLGVTAQKSTATGLWERNIGKYNSIVSTVFTIHIAMSGVIMLGTMLGTFFVRPLLNLPPEGNAEYYRQAFMIFGTGTALLFPLGLFSEILVGLQKIYLRNYIVICSKILELSGILILFRLGGGLISLILFDLGLLILTQLVMMFCAVRCIPGFRFGISFERDVFHEIFHFSFSAFVITLARLAWERGSLILVSIFCGLGPVSTYQIGCRLPVLMSQFTGPLQENISPVTALLSERKKRMNLNRILLNSMRWNSFLASGMTVIVTVFSGELIRFLFKVDDPETVVISRITAFSVCIWLVFRTIPERYLLMAGKHGPLARIFTLESFLFVISAVIVMTIVPARFGLIAVMATSIGAKFVCTMIFILPCLLLETGLRMEDIMRDAVVRPLFASIPVLLSALLIHAFLPAVIGDFGTLAVAGTVCVPLYLICSSLFIFNRRERGRLALSVKKFNLAR